MKRKIFIGIFLTSLLCIVLFAVGTVAAVYNQETSSVRNNLQSYASVLSVGCEEDGFAYLEKIRGYQGRITYINSEGVVLFDNRSEPSEMENHGDRPEVMAAQANGTGQAQRHSDTIGESTLYYATLLDNGDVLRLSMNVDSILSNTLSLVPWLILALIVVLILASFIAKSISKSILNPLNQINLDAPMDADVYEELSPLVRRISAQKEQLQHKAEELSRQQEEFRSVVQNMDEGLILIDHEGIVHMLNQSACQILNIPQDSLHKPLLTLNRDLALQQAARLATGGERTVQEISMQGRRYRVVASPARNEAEKTGAVLLLMDDTERLEAEQNRREFSANVSHELKTPLTSISGYAEIIRNGLVQPNDVAEFAGKIYTEAARLIDLIEDIIQLSRLDEKEAQQTSENVDLLSVSREVARALQGKAEEKQVRITVDGQAVMVQGVTSILHEMIYNLADNAIRYNQDGGDVHISVEKTEGEAVLRVKDTGIGIDTAQQAHVFERFYRVDKSHSRQSGGTGLGLAIVKRGTLFHNGQVYLQSAPGKGSEFTIRLPL